MLSQNSYRPDDILISLSGKSIEVISTDAEGRLVLADGLTYAQQNFSPQTIIDLATLTGGCAVAYGHVRAGVLTNNQSLYRELFESGERTWERIWQLPNDEDYAKLIKGKDADIKNSGGRLASPVTGGMFLKEFVSDEVPWAHLDIAGVADLDEGTDYSVPGATGFGVRLLIDWLSNRNQ
jgi:leucyl aminopeptidase